MLPAASWTDAGLSLFRPMRVRTMPCTTSLTRWRLLLLAALPVSLGAQRPAADGAKAARATPVRVVATTRVSARRQGDLKVNDVSWTCSGSRCSAVAVPTSISTVCRNLALEVGALQSVMVATRALSAAELQPCNDVPSLAETAGAGATRLPAATIAGADSSTRRHATRLVTADDFKGVARPLPDVPGRVKVLPRTKPADTPPAATPPPSTPSPPAAGGPFVPVSVRTPLLTLTGTGVAEVGYRFTPVAVRTGQITLTGTGIAGAPSTFTPVTVRTARITLSGTGRVE